MPWGLRARIISTPMPRMRLRMRDWRLEGRHVSWMRDRVWEEDTWPKGRR
jgi:hypothetical protein